MLMTTDYRCSHRNVANLDTDFLFGFSTPTFWIKKFKFGEQDKKNEYKRKGYLIITVNICIKCNNELQWPKHVFMQVNLYFFKLILICQVQNLFYWLAPHFAKQDLSIKNDNL